MNRSIKEENLTQNLALYISQHGSIMANELIDWIEESSEYVRLTEPVEVRFVALSDKTVLDARVQQIDGKIQKTRAELTRKIDDLKDQKQRLLAITHDES